MKFFCFTFNKYFKFFRVNTILSTKEKNTIKFIHAINLYEKLYKKKIDYIVLLQPTSPFRSVKLFDKTKKIFLKNMYPTYSAKRIMSKNFVFFNNYKHFFLKSKKNFFEINGNLYFISKKDICKKRSFTNFKKFNVSVFKSKKHSIDIDTIYDFEEAKKLL